MTDKGFSMRINSAVELDGAKICVQSGTTTIENLADFFASNNMRFEAVVSSSTDVAVKNYDAGLCSALTSDLSQLYALRLRLAKPGDHVILPDVISKEPLGPAVRKDDIEWLDIVKWVHFALINAEELGVSSKTVAQALNSQKPEVMRLVGTRGNFGEQIGLTNSWAANVVQAVGKLWRDLRPQRRRENKARHSTRAQSIVERRRHSICAADSLSGQSPRRTIRRPGETAG
jgi:general L-amino acid transport system substrate-binding protein